MKLISRLNIFLLLVVNLFSGGCSKNSDPGALPVIVTSVVDVITPISAVCSGNITSEGGSAPSERGVCWSTGPLPVITDNKATGGTGSGEFSAVMTGLSPLTGYHARAYATNDAGTAYGEEISFTTPEDLTGETTSMTDVDGNIYPAIGIGSQIWITENLKTTHFNDGTPIALISDNTTWRMAASPAFCWYENDQADNGETYGALYNWYTVISTNLCPAGWHVPTDAEWTALEIFLGGGDIAGGKIKEAGTSHWLSPNASATNETGFNSLPAGSRMKDGTFSGNGTTCVFWSTTGASNLDAWMRSLSNADAILLRDKVNVGYGCSVRCVKD